MKPIFVILAAGLGTRMRSRRAKVLHRAGGLALVEHVVRSALGVTDAERIVVVLGHQAEQVKVVLAPYSVRFAIQTEQKGTGDAVAAARDACGDDTAPLVVAYGDSPLLTTATFRGLINHQLNSGKAASLITTVLDDPTGYGRIILDDLGDVVLIIEEKSCTPDQKRMKLINSGIYCFQSDLLWKYIGEITPNPETGELYLTDMPEILARHGHKITPYTVADSSQMLGINTRVELATVDTILRNRKLTQLMLDGVTIEKPETVAVDPDVEIGSDTIIEAFARILGTTRIGSDCRIGSSSIIKDCTIGDGAQIEAFSHLDGSTVSPGAQVGPFARLRMQAEIGPDAYIGNFVELKKTRFGGGSKASHLTYLGDSQVGENTNIGAGTITCNYDGIQKHPTTIGKDAFVGSNSTLVAPVQVGDGAYIAAGSVITDPVPAETLALGRSRQVLKEGWVAKRREKLKQAQ